MTDAVQVEGLDDLRRLAAVYKTSDKTIQKAIRTGLQDAAKPLSAEMIAKGAESMPARGGLRARVAAARGGVTASLSGRNIAVSIRAANRQKDSLKGLDAGTLRHPVYGHGPWMTQSVPRGAFSGAFQAGAPQVRDRLRRAVSTALDDIARKA